MLSKKSKKRIIAGVVGLSLVGGTVFAATYSASDKLQTWYNAKLGTSTTKIGTSITTYENSLIGTLTTWFNTTKSNTVANVETHTSGEIGTANQNIREYANEYATEVNDKWTEIINGMQTQYDGYVSSSETTINNLGKQAMSYANGKITSALNSAETKALGDVTAQVGAQQTTSEDALKDLITAAKADIEAKIAAKEKAATDEIKAYLDAKILEDENLVKQATLDLENTKKGNITAAAVGAEQTAKASLDSIVEEFIK